MLDGDQSADNLFSQSLVSADQFAAYQAAVRRITVKRSVAEYLVAVVQATRTDARIQMGVSPRGSKMWLSAARATAALDGRTFVLPDDLQSTAASVLPHRMAARSSSATHSDLVNMIEYWIRQIPVPT